MAEVNWDSINSIVTPVPNQYIELIGEIIAQNRLILEQNKLVLIELASNKMMVTYSE